MKVNNKKALAIAILIPLAVGGLSALLSGGMDIYSRINKPSFAPPGILFPIVWAILYVLMGISSYMIYESMSPNKESALQIYGLQLFFNFFWSIFFFRFEWFLFSFVWLLALIVLIAVMIRRFYLIKPLAGYLQIPYLLWCMFAAYLNFMIYRLN
ncbi:MAG: tryptophan-rich sensory protein [Lachnospiraceae bacterium]|nr:tryptophan-rich sensory protein [Lachnospiraceae bacterium]